MPTRSAENAATRNVRQGVPTAVAARRRGAAPARMPSAIGYMLAAAALSLVLFLVIWFILRGEGEDAPWLPAGLAAGFVILVAAAAREIVMRRAWARYTRELEGEMRHTNVPRRPTKPVIMSPTVHASTAALRALQLRLAEAEAAGAPPEAHLEAYRLCEQYLANTDEVMRTAGGATEVRATLRSGQERVRALQRKHLLTWARGESTRLTHEAQRRVRLSDKIETAQRALEVIDEALKAYPEEQELRDSSVVVRNFIASVKVGQWVEMAERSAFRGKYARAIARYRDALFYLSRADMGEDARDDAANRIQREIELLRARRATAEDGTGTPPGTPSNARNMKRAGAYESRTTADAAQAETDAEPII